MSADEYPDRQFFWTSHQYTPGDSAERYIPAPHNSTSAGSHGYAQIWLAQEDLVLEEVVFRGSTDPGSTTLKLYAGAIPTSQVGTTKTEGTTGAGVRVTTTFGGSWAVTKGQAVGLRVNPTNTPGTVLVSMKWSYARET